MCRLILFLCFFLLFQYVTSPNVMAMVEFFNRVALLAASEILSQDTPSGRARAISKIIQVSWLLTALVSSSLGIALTSQYCNCKNDFSLMKCALKSSGSRFFSNQLDFVWRRVRDNNCCRILVYELDAFYVELIYAGCFSLSMRTIDPSIQQWINFLFSFNCKILRFNRFWAV